jgi:hypothetical protein
MSTGCEYIGAEQTQWPYIKCGCQTLSGQVYCGDHYWKVYQKGSAIAGRTREKAVDREIEELKRLQDLEDLVDLEDLETSGD